MSRGLSPKGHLGRLLYEVMVERRDPTGRRWEARDMAQAIGVSDKTVRDYINGNTYPKNATLWLKVAEVVDVPVVALLFLATGADISRLSAPERPLVGGVVQRLGLKGTAAQGAPKKGVSLADVVRYKQYEKDAAHQMPDVVQAPPKRSRGKG